MHQVLFLDINKLFIFDMVEIGKFYFIFSKPWRLLLIFMWVSGKPTAENIRVDQKIILRFLIWSHLVVVKNIFVRNSKTINPIFVKLLPFILKNWIESFKQKNMTVPMFILWWNDSLMLKRYQKEPTQNKSSYTW